MKRYADRSRERYPGCRQAFLPKGKALKNGNVGVENARPEDIIEALEKAHCTSGSRDGRFTEEDLFQWELARRPQSQGTGREQLGNLLSIGYGNSKSFLRKLNQFQISREEFLEKVKELE